jgi:protoheme ferro-lyase
VGGVIAGAAFVGVLTLRRLHEPLMALAGALGTVLATVGIIRVAATLPYANAVIASVSLSLAAFAGGYGLASALLGTSRSRKRASDLPQADPGDRSIAVILIACIEPETYSTRITAVEIADLSDAGLPRATMGVTPFLFAAQKARYRAVGGTSPSANQARSIHEKLERVLENDGFAQVSLITCVNSDSLENAVREAITIGHTRIIVAPLAVAESHQVDRAMSRVDVLRPDGAGVRLAHTAPLWSSDPLAELVARRVWSARDEPERTGVALVLHGQPPGHEASHAGFDVEESAFANRVRMLLAERGIPEAQIRPCYAEWREPDVTETVRHLAAIGCTRVLIAPAVFPFECLVTLLDIPVAVRQARVDAHVTTVTLNAWGDDATVVDVLADGIRVAARELKSE